MFDDLISPKKEGAICVYDVVDRVREQTDSLIFKLGSLAGVIKQPDRNTQIDVLKKILSSSVEILDVVITKTFFVSPINYSSTKVRSLFPYGASTLTCKEYKSTRCTLPIGKIKSLYLYSWMKYSNGLNILSYAECFNKVYAAETALYKGKP